MKENPLAHNRFFLYLTEFLVGMSLMGVEIGASRLLAPYFSSSQIVWTIIIGTIMVAMAIGNFLGGKMADKHPDVSRLYLFIMLAAAWICLLPFTGRYVIALVSALLALFVTQGLLVWGSLITCLILFVPPLLALGMTTPCLVKYSMGEKASGKVVGTLEALNTVGSIIGTFIPTFVTIPTIGTGFSFLLFGLLVFLVSAAYFLAFFYKGKGQKPEKGEKEENPVISEQKDCKTPSDAKIEVLVSKPKKKRTIGYIIGASISSLAVIAGCVLTNFSSFDFWDKTIIYQGESEYNYLQVKEDSSAIYFSTNVMFGVQSMIKKDDSLTGLYYDDSLGATYMADGYKKGALKMLILGMGTGTVATLSKSYLPFAMDISGVEIDQKIIDLSREYFRLPSDVDVYCDDGRSFLDSDKSKYDVIMVDAYSGISVPFQMASVEFFSSVKSHLVDDGVLTLNMNMVSEKAGSISTALADTISSVFPYVYTYKKPGSTNEEMYAGFNDSLFKNVEDSYPTMESDLKNEMARLVSREGGS
jgi:spermidine synthase